VTIGHLRAEDRTANPQGGRGGLAFSIFEGTAEHVLLVNADEVTAYRLIDGVLARAT